MIHCKLCNFKNSMKMFENTKSGYNQDYLINWMRLARTKNIGNITFHNVVSMFSTIEEAIEHVRKIAQNSRKDIKIPSSQQIVDELDKCHEYGAQIILSSDHERYPKLLREIPDHPPVITIKGQETALAGNKIAIVGSRYPSLNGTKIAHTLATEIGKEGFKIVSGLARGIDATAASAALHTGTIAVIAGGINSVYPHENKSLYEQISTAGLLISEFPFDTAPIGKYFPLRNRIISGLSLGTLVIEAKLKSGTMITARCAAQQDREVFAVPGSPLDPRSEGSNLLIKDGAHMVTNSSDVLTQCYNTELEDKTHSISANQCKIEEDIGQVEDSLNSTVNSTEIEQNKAKILGLISHSPTDINDLSCAELSPKTINTVITELELEGRVERTSINKVILI